MLFYAILFSDCIHSLNPVVRSNVDDLKRFRNDQFSHIPRGYLSSVDFQKAILNISAAFHALGLSVKSQISQFSKRKSQEMFWRKLTPYDNNYERKKRNSKKKKSNLKELEN